MKSNNAFKGKIGQQVEYKAIVWLMDQGYEIFKNVTYHGPIDLVIVHKETGTVRKVDVKKVVDGQRSSTKVVTPSISPTQKQLEVVLLFYDEKHDYFGWSIADIYSNMGKAKRETPINMPCVVEKHSFESLNAAARFHGVKVGTVREWLRRNPSKTIEEAIQHAKNNRKEIIVNGQLFPNKKAACEHFKVNLFNVEYWHYEKGYPFEEAINVARTKTNISGQ